MAAAIAATVALHIRHNRELLRPPPPIPTKTNNGSTISLNINNTSSNYYARKATWRRFQIRTTSSDDSAAATVMKEAEAEVEAEAEEGRSESSPAELPKGPPSLINPLNVQKALRGIPITDVDHYGRLGLQIGCSYDQVRLVYQNKVDELSSQGLDEEELNKKLELLKESYMILSSEQERRIYDWSLARSANPARYVWPFQADITQIQNSPDTPPAQEPEDVGPTRLVGYFFLGWLVLAFTLSIAFNL